MFRTAQTLFIEFRNCSSSGKPSWPLTRVGSWIAALGKSFVCSCYTDVTQHEVLVQLVSDSSALLRWLCPRWCVSSSSLIYGSIAVARWSSLLLVLPCHDLVSCLTWLRSFLCNCYILCLLGSDELWSYDQIFYVSYMFYLSSCMTSDVSSYFGKMIVYIPKRGFCAR